MIDFANKSHTFGNHRYVFITTLLLLFFIRIKFPNIRPISNTFLFLCIFKFIHYNGDK